MISSDKPIKDLKDDKLERKEFIENIFEIIKKQLNKDGVVFGIEGKWGSGKTSILNILENKLVSEEILVFKFNPWNFSTRKQLISDFFEQFSLFIGSRTSMKEDFKEVSKKLKIISSLMKPIGIIPGVSPIISIVENGANIVAKTLDDYSDGKDFETIKKELEIHLENREDRIIVFIDDIDRLPDDEIREIFQLVKGVGDLNNITYLISYDRRIVVEALNKTQEKKGEEYLEKIIQLEFKLPKIKLEMITDIFFKKYLLLVNDIKEEKNNIGKYKEL
ncbi:MAG: KAP family P-loop NTPase fold protein, partial [Cetobacterium sp.]